MKNNNQCAIRTVLLLAVFSGAAEAATTDIATAPLVSGASISVQPNVFLMMDDSGSMGWDYMPDDAGNFSGKYGYASNQCNGVYYDPAYTYLPPVDSTGASYPNSSFTSAWNDGYNTAGGSTNLSTSFSTGGFGTQAAFYFKYSGTQTTYAQQTYSNTSSTFYKECNSAVGSTPGSGVFTKVIVSATSGPGSTDERTNFANWYSYYRIRINMMKTATGLAFKPVGANYRVGFATMNNNGGTDFINVDTFNATQKAAWYAKLYATSPGSSTPLLGALADVGKMYADKLPTKNNVTVVDPMQYSCQQNFTILSTDGFWNSQTGDTQLDGATAVGNQDGTEIRPMYDGATATTTITTPYATIQQRQTVTPGATMTKTWTQYNYAIGAACSTAPPPSGQLSAYVTDNNRQIALASGSSNPANGTSSTCVNLGPSAWLCRGPKGGGNPPQSLSKVTDATGATWYMTSTTMGNTNCTSFNGLFGSTKYTNFVCQGGSGVSGYWVTTTPSTIVETMTGSITSIDNWVATQQTTQTIINGAAGPVSALSPTTLTYTYQNNVSTTVGSITSDTFGPTAATTLSSGIWTAGTPTTVCTAPPIPVAGNTVPVVTATTPPTGGTGTPVTTTLSTNGPTAGMPSSTSTSSGGTFNTLADVAEYYYMTDLRTPSLGNAISSAPGFTTNDVSTNNVPTNGYDAASWQHMTTFTLGLGARGQMVFSPTYKTDTSGDYVSVLNGVTANPPGVCSWQGAGTVCNWPIPVSNTFTTIDDLWHAAVDGRGTYFNAANPGLLALGLQNALAGVSARIGTSAAATASNPNITSGDNFIFSSTFFTGDWTGDLIREQLNLANGTIVTDAAGNPVIDWSAQALLDARTYASRAIYTFNPAQTNNLIAFNATNFGANPAFNPPNINTLSQFCGVGPTCLSAASQSLAAGGTLVNYLIGDRSNEGAVSDTTKYYRLRNHVLGDIVDAEAVYVKGTLQGYADPGFAAYASSVSSRQGMVYAAANDGMLHAFYAGSGQMDPVTGQVLASGGVAVAGGDEAWAYVPSMLLPNLYKLADKNYVAMHQYYVDGTPVVGDICVSACGTSSAVWKTILVGGLNAGGKGYYALDITNPAAPKGLWEFTDANLGYTFGNPQIAKLADGTWVVVFTSGYNNADGVGRLFVVNANSGVLVATVNPTGVQPGMISTGVGSATTPSGLAHIIAQVANPAVDDTILQVYGGDLQGNVWRFDVNNNVGAAGFDAQLLVTLTGPTGLVQPVTVKPEVGICTGNFNMVYVGTGRYLGVSDLSNTDPQSIYAIRDPLATGTTPNVAIYPNVRGTGSTFVQQTVAISTCPANAPTSICLPGQTVLMGSSNAVSYPANGGWFLDLPYIGERDNTDPQLRLGTLAFTTNIPSSGTCTVGGTSNNYFFDFCTGAPIKTTNGVLGVKLGNALATRPVDVRLPNGTVVELIRLSDGTTVTRNLPINAPSAGTRRVSYHQLIDE